MLKRFDPVNIQFSYAVIALFKRFDPVIIQFSYPVIALFKRFDPFTFRMVIGLADTGILYGVQNLSGNFYLNLFLYKLVQIPAKSLGIWLQNR